MLPGLAYFVREWRMFQLCISLPGVAISILLWYGAWSSMTGLAYLCIVCTAYTVVLYLRLISVAVLRDMGLV